jgi:hypothetical protein
MPDLTAEIVDGPVDVPVPIELEFRENAPALSDLRFILQTQVNGKPVTDVVVKSLRAFMSGFNGRVESVGDSARYSIHLVNRSGSPLFQGRQRLATAIVTVPARYRFDPAIELKVFSPQYQTPDGRTISISGWSGRIKPVQPTLLSRLFSLLGM